MVMISFYLNGDDPVKDPDFSNLRANSKEKCFNIIGLFDRLQNNTVCLVKGGQNSNNLEVRETKILQHFL